MGKESVSICNEQATMAGNGWPSSSTTEIFPARIEEMIQDNRQATLCEISLELGLSPTEWHTAYHFFWAAIFQDSVVETYAETWLNELGPDFYQDELTSLSCVRINE
ncbi:hypothetical protein TNCV_1317311 [Trichonephila clavipes]|nr:hypothetical protein TNCV_1317311 [Trichonephila clavipes]